MKWPNLGKTGGTILKPCRSRAAKLWSPETSTTVGWPGELPSSRRCSSGCAWGRGGRLPPGRCAQARAQVAAASRAQLMLAPPPPNSAAALRSRPALQPRHPGLRTPRPRPRACPRRSSPGLRSAPHAGERPRTRSPGPLAEGAERPGDLGRSRACRESGGGEAAGELGPRMAGSRGRCRSPPLTAPAQELGVVPGPHTRRLGGPGSYCCWIFFFFFWYGDFDRHVNLYGADCTALGFI